MSDWKARFWNDNKALFVFIALMFVFRSAVADWNDVPTSSMKPTIVVGDRILVNKLAYDVRVPFTMVSLYKLADPVRGDVIIFESAAADKRLVKRVVGMPGDVISMRHKRLKINGQDIAQTLLNADEQASVFTEHLLGTQYSIRLHDQLSSMAHFAPVVVPENHYLALGDNRDNSGDSRVIGFVPRDEIIGRTQRVVLSFDYNNYFLPRSSRFLHTL